MKTKLLKIIRTNFDIRHPDGKWFAWENNSEKSPLFSFTSFDLIVKMLEQIYPQGKHYRIMRHSRRYKQARNERTVGTLEVASVCIVAAILITILILNTCCGSGEQY